MLQPAENEGAGNLPSEPWACGKCDTDCCSRQAAGCHASAISQQVEIQGKLENHLTSLGKKISYYYIYIYCVEVYSRSFFLFHVLQTASLFSIQSHDL